MKVELADEAKHQAREENAWWRENRDSKILEIYVHKRLQAAMLTA